MVPDNYISFSHVSFSYDRALILQDINLQIKAKSLTLIFGPNGGGKTTFLNLLLGFLKPTKGELLIEQKSPRLMTGKIGYVPQFNRLDKHFPITVEELVLTGALSQCRWWGGYPKKTYQSVDTVLEKVSLLDFKKKPFNTLSGGQAQRVLLARALISQPSLLVLDEATANVDQESEHAIYHLLSDLKDSLTIVMVTHDFSAILNQADQLLFIKNTVSSLKKEEACAHYAVGLYHPPLQR
ncbi:MAG: metal ABC transporter ATP-binding protein [Rhabdochlamydiaceae bacterium]